MPGALVRVAHLSRSHGDRDALRDVSFTVPPGSFVVVTGPSGSGKLTLLQLIGALDRSTGGHVFVDEVDVGALPHPVGFRRSTVGFVFQSNDLLASLTVAQNVELPLVGAHVPRGARHARALQLLDEVGLPGRARDLPSELSGGERQRVATARALANHPALVLADEPTGSLDAEASREIWRLLASLCAAEGTTVIVASHDPTVAERADRTLHLVDGALVSDGAAVCPAGTG
ncbi:MAG TPA: ABC transporter ATP-binding protein [Solirubrobacteraceae bacterium]|nr:ABC transporter ATP-binding protein [Solirubrobacteraceae bacterium]